MKKFFTLFTALLASISLSWANQTTLIDGVTLPDVPASSLDLATQTFKTADENGWIVMEPNADIRYASVTWFTAMKWNTTSVTINDVSSFTAPFTTLNSVSCTTVQKTDRTKAIRFTNATDISFLVLSGGSRTIYVSLFSYSGGVQTLVETKSTNQNSATELLFSDLATTTDYIAYMYESTNSNGVVAEIAIKKFVNSSDPVAEVTIDGPTLGTKDIKSTFTATTDVKADAYKWFVNDEEQAGATNKTFEFTPTAIGSYNVVCKARNANNGTDEWIASSAITLKVYSQVCGEIIKATHTGKTTATVTGLIGGTAEKSTESSGKLNSNGYFGITLASGNFQEGDTLNVHITGANTSAAVLIVYEEKTAENVILNTGVAGVVGDNKFALPATINGKNTLYIVRTEANAWNAVVDYISVIRPIPSKSTVESLTAVSVDDVAISAANLATLLADHEVTVANSYVDAPVVKFTKHTVITYEDDSEKESDQVISVTATEVSGEWQAAATINSIEYVLKAAKLSSVIVTYMDGETKLGEENVEVGGHPANYAQYQNKSLSSFVAWFNNPDLAEEHKVADIAAEVINVATTFYAKFEKTYAQSINIEQAVLDHGTSYNVVAQMGGIGYASNITNSLDTLNDLENKANRNYAYLGLKVKAAGKLLDFRLANGSTVKVKFGNIGKTPLVSINGADYADMTITDGVYTYTAEADALVSIKTADGNTVVFKQIMIDEDLQEVPLPTPGAFLVTVSDTIKNGKVTVNWPNKKYRAPVGETITLTFEPDAGYLPAVFWANEVRLNQSNSDIVGNQLTFEMPAEDVVIGGQFTESGTATGMDNTNDAVKAVKRIVNGQLVIEKNGVLYNAQGAVVK